MSSLFEKRANKVSNIIADLGYDGFYITNITNIRYLTGFTGSAGLLIILHNKAFFFTDGRYIQQSKQQVQNAEIYIISTNYFNAIKEAIKQFQYGDLKIAFEANHMSYAYYLDLVNNFSKINFIRTNSIIENIAAVKDADEIDALQTAVDITDEVFTKIIPEIKSGVTEKYIAARISYLFKTHGADGDSYESIIAAGPNSALPHARPTDKEFQKGDFIVMDFGALYNGYHADMTRTVLMGPITKKHQQIYDIVLKSQLQGIAHAKEGVPCSSVDKACRDIIDSAGYGDFFNHSTGHGIGLEVHTLPRIHKSNNQLLKSNHVITIEPGIYLPDWGGVRIEDDCLIMKNKCVPLNKSTKELISI